jgi:hypothetical protein
MQESPTQPTDQNQIQTNQTLGKSRFSSMRTLSRNKPPQRIWLIIILVVVIIIAATLFMLSRPKSESEESNQEPEETTLDTFTFEDNEETPSPTPTQAEIDKTKIAIRILNGTGIAKQAAFLEGELIKIGYENFTVGNAETQDKETTTATFSSDVPTQARQEVFDRLEELYQRVETETKEMDDVDILIIVGVKKGQTLPSPTVSPTPATSEDTEEATASAKD